MRIVDRFNYLGPNRRMAGPGTELQLAFSQADLAALSAAHAGLASGVGALLEGHGIPGPHDHDAGTGEQANPAEAFCHAVNTVTRRLLESAGHRTTHDTVIFDPESSQYGCVVECEDSDSCERAIELALDRVGKLVPGLEREPEENRDSTGQTLTEFMEFAGPRAMPADTLAVIEAAQELDVPVIRLDRDPYEGVGGDFRVRPNTLLLLGQCGFQQILDGMIYVTRSSKALQLVHRPELRHQFLRSLGLPVAAPGSGMPASHALLVANGELLCCLQPDPARPESWQLSDIEPHPTLRRLACDLAAAAQVAVARIDVVAEDISAQPGTPAGARGIADLDPAPKLDQLLSRQPEILATAGRALVRWAFPEGARCRIPVVAITGTNGKSTTSAMINGILQAAGLRTGLAHTEGVIIDGQLTEEGDLAGGCGHYRVFEAREVEAGVLETARGGVLKFGFAFDRCDVAVCLNVEADHLGLEGIHSVEQMAEVKRSVVARAREAAVLNADDTWCAAMANDVPARTLCLVSMKSSLDSLQSQFPRATAFCTLESRTGTETIVLVAEEQTILEMPVSSLPAAFGGGARFNIENAMHAIPAAHFLGAPPKAIVEGISAFRPGYETLPGRMNFYDELPFRVLMDYVHNEHGLHRLLDFLRSLDVPGRRIVASSVGGDRTEAQLRGMMELIADEFDLFILKDYPGRRGRRPLEIPELCREALLELGVPAAAITLVSDEVEACAHCMQIARPGDLLLFKLAHDSFEPVWKLITQWDADSANAS